MQPDGLTPFFHLSQLLPCCSWWNGGVSEMSVSAPMPVALPSVLACSEEKQKNLEKQNVKIFFEYKSLT